MKHILVIDENRSKMDISVDMFMDLLDTKVERIIRAKDSSLLATSTFIIRFMVANKYSESMRGIKADYVIDSTGNLGIHSFIPLMLGSSVYNR